MRRRALLLLALACFVLAGAVAVVAQAPAGPSASHQHQHAPTGPDWKWIAIFIITAVVVPGLGAALHAFYRQVVALGAKLDHQSSAWSSKLDELKKCIQESVLQVTRLEERLEAHREDLGEVREVAVRADQKATRLHARVDVVDDRVARCPNCPDGQPTIQKGPR